MNLIGEQARNDIARFLGDRSPSGGMARLLTFSTKPNDFICEYCDEVRQLADELVSISSRKIVPKHHLIEDAKDTVDRLRVKGASATVVTDEKMDLAMKFYGIPSGQEFTALLKDVVDAATRTPPNPSEETLRVLRAMTKEVPFRPS